MSAEAPKPESAAPAMRPAPAHDPGLRSIIHFVAILGAFPLTWIAADPAYPIGKAWAAGVCLGMTFFNMFLLSPLAVGLWNKSIRREGEPFVNGIWLYPLALGLGFVVFPAYAVGAAWAGAGRDVILGSGLSKALTGLFLSPILGLIFGYLVVQVCYALSASATPHLNRWFQRGQVLVSFLMAISFGSNDGQKLMGIIVLGLVANGSLTSFEVPAWVILYSTLALGIGTLMGGWRLIHTMGGKFYTIRPIHGFGAQGASAGVIFAAGMLGWPVSGSQVVTSAIVGAGSADRIQKVRWGVVQQILVGWFLTLPSSACASALIYYLIEGMAS